MKSESFEKILALKQTNRDAYYSVRHSAFSPIEENLSPMGTSREEAGSGNEAFVLPIWDCGSPLYDSHELVSIVYTIERHVMLWPNHDGSKPVITQFPDSEEVISIRCISKDSSMKNKRLKKKLTHQRIKKKHKKIKDRFSGLVCGGNILQSLMGF